MTDAKDVARYIIKLADEADEGISNLKLQKLVYYAQGFYIALNDAPLFDEKIEAWAHGPVVPSLYHEFKSFGREPIEIDLSSLEVSLTKDQKEHIEEVFEIFGQFSAWKLRNMTHEEKPWIDNEAFASEITHKEMKDYFLTRIE